ncbi:hypothetical protein ACSSV1_000615 [Labrenzia sp. MBR-25]|jgi:hypothetical protein
MFGFLNVVGATLRETTRSADNNTGKAPKAVKAVKPVK